MDRNGDDHLEGGRSNLFSFLSVFVSRYIGTYILKHSCVARIRPTLGIFNIFGSYFWGVMGDKFDKRYVMTSLYLIRSVVIGAFVVLPVTVDTATIFGAAIGFCWLGTVLLHLPINDRPVPRLTVATAT